MFCASVSGYMYICSKLITAPMIHDRGSDMIGKYFIFCTHVAYVSFKGLFHALFVGLCGLCHAFAIPCLCNLDACLLVVQCHAFYFKYITLVPL